MASNPSPRPEGRPADATDEAAPPHADGRVSRRVFLTTTAVAAGSVATATLAACAPGAQTATKQATRVPFALGRPATLRSDATVPAALAARLVAKAGKPEGIPSVTAAPPAETDADLVATFGSVPTGYVGAVAGQSAATLIAHLRVPVEEVSADQARGLLSGAVGDWRDVGAPASLPVRVFTLAGMMQPSGVTLASGAEMRPSADELIKAVRETPGAVALVPVELAEWRVKNVAIAGVAPARGKGDAAKAALAPFALTVGVRRELADKGLDAKALAPALAGGLAAATQTFDMVVGGDIILGRGVNNKMVAYNDYTYPYKAIRDEFLSADYRVANLECCITDLVAPPKDDATFTFITAKRAVEGLTFAGLQTVSVANNHADNGGVEAFLDMLNTLREKNIQYCGGGKDLAEARLPAIQQVKGVRVAILAYNNIAPGGPYATESSGGIAPINPDTFPQDIRDARTKADLVIPFFHWGIEYTKDPTREQQTIARAAIDAGADMVLGSHPHWVQGIEDYNGRLIIYCLGNFIFDQDWSRPTQEGTMLHLYWRGTTLAGMKLVPYTIRDRCQPNIIGATEAVAVFDRIWSGTDMLANGQYGPEYEP